MKKLLLAALLAAALVLLVIALASAAAQERPFRATFAGIVTNQDDLSFTGILTDTSSIGVVTGKSTLGNYTAQMVATFRATGKGCATADGGKGVELAPQGEVWVLTFDCNLTPRPPLKPVSLARPFGRTVPIWPRIYASLRQAMAAIRVDSRMGI